MVCSKFALVHSVTRKREFAQTAVLAFSELALVAAVMTIGLLAAPVQLAIAPRTTRVFGPVHAIRNSLAMLQELGVELADVVAAPEQQRAFGDGGFDCRDPQAWSTQNASAMSTFARQLNIYIADGCG